MEAGSIEQKEGLVAGYLVIYDDMERDSANAMTEVESFAASTFDAESIRAWQYWITLDTLLTVRLPKRISIDKSYL